MRNRALRNVGWLALTYLVALRPAIAGDRPSVPKEYDRFFVQYKDDRSLPERILNELGFSLQDVGRSYALVAGIGSYPKMDALHTKLPPAYEDINHMAKYFKEVEYFDEIVVLKDSDMNYSNLAFFLQSYFPEQLRSHPKSRFIFAYSGHGMKDPESSKGYLLTSDAETLTDKRHGLDLEIVRTLMDGIIRDGYHTLALINACHSGAFLRRVSFGGKPLKPKKPGAHVLVCGGVDELGYHIPSVGTGSVDVGKILAGLGGIADTYPKETDGDGRITFDELATYVIQEVRFSTDSDANPIAGDISPHGSAGSIFFLNREHFAKEGAISNWKPAKGTTFGENSPTDQTLIAPNTELQDIFSLSERDRPASELRSILSGFQITLQRAGFYEGSADGIPGPKTKAAILQWQKTYRLSETGDLTEETTRSLKEADLEPPASLTEETTASSKQVDPGPPANKNTTARKEPVRRSPQPSPPPSDSDVSIPWGKAHPRINKAVISPYDSNAVVDASSSDRGDILYCPTTHKPFRNPWKR